MGSAIPLDIELNEVKSFLTRVYSVVDSEYAALIARIEVGEFTKADESANAFFWPRMTEQIAMKAAVSEINSIVEWELYGIASKPFMERTQNKKEQSFGSSGTYDATIFGNS